MLTVTDPEVESTHSNRSRWLWIWTAGAVLVSSLAFLAGQLVKSPWDDAIENSSASIKVTAPIEVREFRAEGLHETGKITLGVSEDVMLESGDSKQIVTRVGVEKGDKVRSGTLLAVVSGRPIVALKLPFDLYRDILPGDTGDDVIALQESLKEAGFFTGVVDGTYGAQTAQAMEQLYSSINQPAPAAASETQAAVREAEDAVRDAKQGVAAENESDTSTVQNEEAQPTTTAQSSSALNAAQQSLADAQFAALTPLRVSEIWRIAGTSTVIRVATIGTNLSSTESPVMTLRRGKTTVEFRAPAAQQDAISVDTPLTVSPVDDSSATYPAKVTRIGDFNTDASAETNVPGRDITATLSESNGLKDGDSVNVTLADAGTPDTGLAVPLTALRESNGRKVVLVESASKKGTEFREVPVTVGATADGYVLVESTELSEGQKVLVSE